MTVSRPVAPHPPGQVAHEGARCVANRGGAHRALQHGGEEGAEELVRDGPQLLFALLRFLCRAGRWSTRLKLPAPAGGQCAGGRECCQDRSRGSGCRWRSCPFQRTIMSSPSRNVQYHPPRLSEDRLNLPQPHSPTALLREIGNAPLLGVPTRIVRKYTVRRVAGASSGAHETVGGGPGHR